MRINLTWIRGFVDANYSTGWPPHPEIDMSLRVVVVPMGVDQRARVYGLPTGQNKLGCPSSASSAVYITWKANFSPCKGQNLRVYKLRPLVDDGYMEWWFENLSPEEHQNKISSKAVQHWHFITFEATSASVRFTVLWECYSPEIWKVNQIKSVQERKEASPSWILFRPYMGRFVCNLRMAVCFVRANA